MFGNNDLESFPLFIARKKYEDEIISQLNEPQYFNMWNKEAAYGKMDQFQDSIFPSESSLKQLEASETVLVLDFVADAYKDLKDFIQKAAILKKIKINNSFVTRLEPKQGWTSISKLYHSKMENFYNAFVLFSISKNEISSKIVSFETFLYEFEKFVLSYLNEVVFTKTNFILSNLCSPLISGLVIDFKVGDCGNDEVKEKEYLEDANYDFYRFAARQFGFRIDKNVPWRLIADITTEQMKKYMKNYGIEGKDPVGELFDVYFYRTFEQDVDLIRSYLIHFYNSYVAVYPFYTEFKKCKGTVKARTVERQSVSEKNVDNYNYWITLYYKLRIKEAKLNWSGAKVEKELKKVIDIEKTIDKKAAIRYINKQTRIVF